MTEKTTPYHLIMEESMLTFLSAEGAFINLEE